MVSQSGILNVHISAQTDVSLSSTPEAYNPSTLLDRKKYVHGKNYYPELFWPFSPQDMSNLSFINHRRTIMKGTLAPQAAGVIHTDFERGFIKVRIAFWADFFWKALL